MNGKVSHVKQYLQEQENKAREKPNLLLNRKNRSSSLDNSTNIPTDATNLKNKELATFKNGKGVSVKIVYSFQVIFHGYMVT